MSTSDFVSTSRINSTSGIPRVYRDAMNKLIKSLKRVDVARPPLPVPEVLQRKRELFEDFHEQYTMTPFLWAEWYELESGPTEDEAMETILFEALPYFYVSSYYRYRYPLIDDTTGKADVIHKVLNMKLISLDSCDVYQTYEAYYLFMKDSLKFPHSRLVEFREALENEGRFALTGFPLDEYNNARDLYAQISEARGSHGSDRKWFEVLSKVEDIEFFIRNGELRIGEDFTKKSTWKLFIDHLSKKEDIHVLKVYKRYCRFFDLAVKDGDMMLMNYLDEIYKFDKRGQNVSPFLMDILFFHIQFRSPESSRDVLIQALGRISLKCHPFYRPAKDFAREHKFVNMECAFQQYKFRLGIQLPTHYTSLPLPASLLFFIRKKASFKLRMNLMKCNALFTRMQEQEGIPVWNLQCFEGLNETRFLDYSLAVNYRNPDLGKFSKILVYNLFSTRRGQGRANHLLNLANFVPVVRFYNLQHLDLNFVECTFDHLYRLVRNNRIKKVSFDHMDITTADGNYACSEAILALFPYAEKFSFGNSRRYCTHDTLRNLADAEERPVKLRSLVFSFNNFDEKIFLTFLRKNLANHGQWRINMFEYDGNVQALQRRVNDVASGMVLYAHIHFINYR